MWKGRTMKKAVYCLEFLLLLLAFSGCGRNEEVAAPPSPQAKGDFKASAAYRTYFGEPPTVADGKSYAMVAYAPVTAQPGKITPFPLFLPSPDTPLETVIGNLLKGEEPNMSVTPFPRGTKLLSLDLDGDLLRVELSGEALNKVDASGLKVILAVLGHTVVQSDEVRRVMVIANGKLLPFQADRGFFPDPSEVVPPGPPRVLSVAGTWKKKKKAPEDISVIFDRPVKVDKVEVFVEGKPLEGDYSLSAFDTAMVVRPRKPAGIREGWPVVVAWQGVDQMGRGGGGEEIFMLSRVERR